jgi:TRAP-type C4-dicarboxylate transport system permease small subunit
MLHTGFKRFLIEVSPMRFLTAVNDFLVRIAKFAAITAFIVMVISSSLQIIFRFVLNIPLPWSEELSRFAFVWSTTLGISIFMRGRKHSSVDILETILPPKYKKVLLALTDILCELFFIVMIIGGIRMVNVTMNQISPALSVPMGTMYLSIPLSAAIMMFMSAENFLNLFYSKEGRRQ